MKAEIRRLAFNGATNRDISELLRIDEAAMEEAFSAVLVEARASRRISIRGKQTEVAVKGGNAAMLSLLGKHELGQTKTADEPSDDDWPEPQLDPKVG